MAPVVETRLFQAEGAFLHWPVVARRLGMVDAATGRLPLVLQLRWALHPELGLPTEPFWVWRRHRKLNRLQPVRVESTGTSLFGGATIVDLLGSYTHLDLVFSGAGPGVVVGFVGSPEPNRTVAFAAIPAGNPQRVSLTAPAIEGLVISNGTTLASITGVRGDQAAGADGWERHERVGLPVKKDDWAGQGLGQHGSEQGMADATTDALTAARQRLERGAPPVGWAPLIRPGLPAPAWVPASSGLVIADLQSVLADLRGIAGQAPGAQQAARIVKPVSPPENSSGQRMSGSANPAEVSPLAMVHLAASLDGYNALGLGFGTAYLVVQTNERPSALDFDYRVTARYERGPSGAGEAVEYAAIVPSPQQAIATPVPAAMASQAMGHLRPLAMDGAWRGSVRIAWDKPVPVPLMRPRSYAFARAGLAPPAPAEPLMNLRGDARRNREGARLPIAINDASPERDPEPNRVSAVDREIPIPTDPGSRSARYAVAQQDLYGQWSAWVAVDATIAQPPVDEVRIVSASFRCTAVPTPPAGLCAAELVVEFLWDWRVRSPAAIGFRGRLHPAGWHGQPPPDTTLPGGLQTRLGGPFATAFTLNFDLLTANGAPTSSWPGFDPAVHVLALDPTGEQVVAFGAAQGGQARRYRAIVTGFQLDFAAAGHIGLALWAQGQEAIPPRRLGAWSHEPSVIAASDPRPPRVVPDLVTLASLPDAAGESHAILSWSGSSGGTGWFVYETTETRLLTAAGEPEPDPARTLSERLTRLKQIFDADPLRRRGDFTRRNARPIPGTSTDVTLPRGSTAIHLYVVLGLSAGQVEAAWPTSSAMLHAYAAPRVPKPAAPRLEARRELDTTAVPPVFRARLIVTTGAGPRVRRIDLHRVRVDDAARELDTMGPPLRAIDPASVGWQIEQTTDARGAHIARAEGLDTPPGSWKRVWYRVAAWSTDDALRGTLGARSPASPAAWVVIPPATPPDLSAVTLSWPGGPLGDALAEWTSAAPVGRTPLGTHTLSVRVRRLGSAPEDAPWMAIDAALADLPATAPATGSGVWREGESRPQRYRALLRRDDVADALQIAVHLTDPLGRTSEALATLPAGPLLPEPVLTAPSTRRVLAPPGVQIGWSSASRLDAGLYTLRVTVSRPPLRIGRRTIPTPAISLQMALSDVPLDEPGPVPAGTDPLRVRRIDGAGPDHAYYAFVRVAYTRVTVTLSSADGRSAQFVQLPL